MPKTVRPSPLSIRLTQAERVALARYVAVQLTYALNEIREVRSSGDSMPDLEVRTGGEDDEIIN